MNQQRRVEYIVFTEEGAGKWTSENCNIENSTGDRKEHGQTGPGKASGKMDVLVPSKETNLDSFGVLPNVLWMPKSTHFFSSCLVNLVVWWVRWAGEVEVTPCQQLRQSHHRQLLVFPTLHLFLDLEPGKFDTKSWVPFIIFPLSVAHSGESL